MKDDPKAKDRPRLGRSKALKWKRNQRLKQVLVLALVLLLMGDLLPYAIGDVSPTTPTGSYGVEQEMQSTLDKRHSDKWEAIVRSEAEGDLNSIDISKVDRTPVNIDEQVVLMYPTPPVDPSIYNIIETTTLPNRITMIEFLVNQPMSYYIYTISNGNGKWTQGIMRPDLFIDWDPWAYIDVDDDPTTGDVNGNDVRVNVDLTYDSWNFTIPRPLQGVRSGATFYNSGLLIEIEKLSGPNASAYLPLDIFIVKSFSYTGNNYLWTIGFEWSDMPNTFLGRMRASTITASRPDFKIPSLGDPSFFEDSALDIEGPYNISFDMDVKPPDMLIHISYSKVQFGNLVERIWDEIHIDPADGLNRVPETFNLYLESPSFNKSFDKLLWSSTIPAKFSTIFKDSRQNTTYSELMIEDMPTSLLIELIDIVDPADQSPATSVHFETSQPIKLIDYFEYEFIGNKITDFTHSHAILKDLPNLLYLNGTFDIGGEDEIGVDNLAIGFPARIMDSTMVNLVSKLFRISKTLRTIPNNIINMPDNKGWAELTVLGGDVLGSIEFFVSSRSRIEAQGDYIAFRNDTLEIKQDPNIPLINSSLSGRLTDLSHMKLDFRKGTVVDLDIPEPRPFRILFIDDGNSARATLEIDQVPPHFLLSFHPDKIKIVASEDIASFAYTSLVGEQYFQLMLEGIPSQVEIDQSGGRMKLSTPKDTSITSFSAIVTDRQRLSMPNKEYNHIFMDRTSSSYLTSLRLNYIRSIDMQTTKGGFVNADFAKERDLYIDLMDSILDIQTRILFKPFPSNFSIELPRGFTISGMRLPNVLNVSSIFAFSPIILQMAQLGNDLVNMTAELTSNIATQLGSIGSNTTIKIRSKVPTIMIADMRQGPADEVIWLHGINVGIDRQRDAIRARIYMRLPLEANIKIQSTGDLIDMDLEFNDFTPIWEFIDIRITGMEDRDISMYIDGLSKETHDVHIKANLDTNMTPGTGTVISDITVDSETEISAVYIHMRKSGDIASATTVYFSSLPKRYECHIELSDHLELDWDASSTTKNVYVLIQKQIDDEWHDVSLIMNKVPTKLSLRASKPDIIPDMDASLLQGLPEVSVSGSTTSLSIYLYMEGEAMGMPSDYEIHLRDVTDDTFTAYDPINDIYKIRSRGTGFVYIRIIDMPYSEKFRITEAELFLDEVYSVDIKASQAFGTYPILEIMNFNADSLQLRTKTKIHVFGALREGSLIYVDISTNNGLPWSTQITRNGFQITDGDYHLLIPAPIATMMSTLFSGG